MKARRIKRAALERILAQPWRGLARAYHLDTNVLVELVRRLDTADGDCRAVPAGPLFEGELGRVNGVAIRVAG